MSRINLNRGVYLFKRINIHEMTRKLNGFWQNFKVGVFSDCFSIELVDFIQKGDIKTA